jgi:hypothetical protein
MTVDEAARLGANKKQQEIVDFINKYAAEWRKPTAVNVRAEMFKLADIIKEME